MRKTYLVPRAGIEREFDLLFVDTEFTQLPFPGEAVWEWASRVTVLAVGVACFDSVDAASDFYAVRRIDESVLRLCSDFVKAEVIPNMEADAPNSRFRADRDLKRSLNEYLAARRRITGKAPLFVVDWIGDAFLIDRVFATESDWMLVEEVAAVREAMATPFIDGRKRHNAYHDALAMRAGFHKYRELAN